MADLDRIESAVEQLLARDRTAHAEAVSTLAASGNERVVPYLVEVCIIDAIANDWASFGFPEVLRDRDPPRYLDLPEVAWPGIVDGLCTLCEPDFDGDYAWVKWESWYSQQDLAPLAGFDDWKLRLFRSYLPPVGGLLDTTPRAFDLQAVRWGNTDRSYLAALNEPSWVDAGVSATYLDDSHLVFGFTVGDQAYAVPRWILFPHELANFTVGGMPLSLTYCTLCNAPILYDRRVEGEVLTFGSSGLLLDGNKVMYDEATESLWRQHAGVPIGGPYLDREVTLAGRPVTQADWADWRADQPDSLVIDLATGYDFDYRFYDGYLGFFDHYWTREDIVQPGVRQDESRLPEKTSVYGVTGTDPDRVHVYPIEAVRERGPLTDEIGGQSIVVIEDPTGDVAVYEAPPLPIEREGDELIDATGMRWVIERDGLDGGDARRDRIAGRHGLWFAFRTQYPEPTVVTGE